MGKKWTIAGGLVAALSACTEATDPMVLQAEVLLQPRPVLAVGPPPERVELTTPTPGGSAPREALPPRSQLLLAIDNIAMARFGARLLAAWEEEQPAVDLQLLAAASRTATGQVLVGRADLALILGELSPNERARGLVAHRVGDLVFALVAHRAVGLRSLDPVDVHDLLTGRTRQWGELRAAGGEVVVVVPPAGPESRLLTRLLLPGDDLVGNRIQLRGDEAILRWVAKTPGALGVVAAHSLGGDAAVRALAVSGVSPSPVAFRAGVYPCGRRLLLVSAGGRPGPWDRLCVVLRAVLAGDRKRQVHRTRLPAVR